MSTLLKAHSNFPKKWVRRTRSSISSHSNITIYITHSKRLVAICCLTCLSPGVSVICRRMTYSESKWLAPQCSDERIRDIVSQISVVSRPGLGVLLSWPPANPDGGGGRRPSDGGDTPGYGRTNVDDATIPLPSVSGPPKPRRIAAAHSSSTF